MNPFQRAREQAIELRKKLLGERSGEIVHLCDFLNPEVIEQRLDLGIAFVPKGATELGEADAIFRRSEGYLYVRDDVSDPEKGHLIAHELGHNILDEGQEETLISSLKSLVAAEGSPAVIKVESYGARERQELRANVFARELQLPRTIARELYELGVGPRKVATDYGIHLEVVRQQMLDAVMLPLLGNSTETKVVPPPSPDQLRAIKAPERFVNVVAGPGSGKTTTLIHRVKFLIEEQGVDPTHILVLTFTNKAAFELIERLREAGITRAADVWAGTFHAFGLEFLRKYHQCFGLNCDVTVADKLNSVTLLSRELPKLDLKYYKRVQDPYDWLPNVVDGIKRMKEELVTPEDYRTSLSKLHAISDHQRLQREDVATLYECHERLLRAAMLVDFVDLVSKPAKALKEDRARYGEIADKFQYVLVDEYQDVTFAMIKLIRQLAKNAKSLWVVGDVRQAIHHWRGASVYSLVRFEQTFKSQGNNISLRTYPLELNRRSSSEILEVVQQVGRCHILEKDLKLVDTKATSGKVGHSPRLVQCQSAVAVAEAVAEGVKEMHENGVPYSNQAVLSRWNSDIQRIVTSLREEGIPVLYIGELAQRREVKNLLCLMQLLVEHSPRALVGLAGEPGMKVELGDLHILIEACAQDPQLLRCGWRDKFPEGISKRSHAALENIRDLLQGQMRRSSPWGFVCDILLERRFGYPNLSDQSIDAHVTRIALWQFAYTTRTGGGEGKIPSLARFLLRQQLRQRIGETYADRELPGETAGLEAVRMLTVHGSKGLEFDVVHLANLNIDDYGQEVGWRGAPTILDIVPPEALRSKREDWDFEAAVERNNLLYVAVSRARNHLLMYEYSEDPQKRTPQLVPLSVPLKRLSFTAKSLVKGPNPPATIGTVPDLMPFSEFVTYVRCPHLHWYRYVLGLSSEQQRDITIRTQFAIMAALKGVAINPAQKHSAFDVAWHEYKLPPKIDDDQLWMHAKEVFEFGVRVIEQSQGLYAEPDTLIDGFKIRLPWLLLNETGRKPSIELLIFSSNLDDASKLWRPMLNGLEPKDASELTMHCLLDNRSRIFKPSQRISSTKAYISIQKYRTGDREPVTGKHCSWCAYSTLCPTWSL